MKSECLTESLPVVVDLCGEQPDEKESAPKPKRWNGTVIRWWADAGQILSDNGEVLDVHQVDLQFHGKGKRILPVGYQCEFERCLGVNKEPRACEVSRSAGRPWVFNDDEDETESSDPVSSSKDIFAEPNLKYQPDKLMKYLCILETDLTVDKGTVKFFHAELHYACIEPDDRPGDEIFCDASGFVKTGSYMCVRRGVRVEYIKGINAAGQVVATRCTGPNSEPIHMGTERRYISLKRKLTTEAKEKRKKWKEYHSELKIPPKPDIPDGKNPVCILYEFVRCCKPKKVVSFKLIDQKKRARCVKGARTSFTMECRIDEKEISQGIAATKKLAKTYAAQLAIDALSKTSAKSKTEIERIRSGVSRRQILPAVPYKLPIRTRVSSQPIVAKPITVSPVVIYPLNYSASIGLAQCSYPFTSNPPSDDEAPSVVPAKSQVSCYSQAGYVQALVAPTKSFAPAQVTAASLYGQAYSQYQAAYQALTTTAISALDLEHSAPTYAPPKFQI